jgi:hypothetical protein
MICPPGARHSPSDGCRHDLFWLTLLNRLWVADAAGSRLAGMDGPVSLSRAGLGAAARLLRAAGERGVRRGPAQVVDNLFVAAAYARVVVGFLRAGAQEAAPARAAHWIRASRSTSWSWAPAPGASRMVSCASWARLDALPLGLPPIVYVMTDLAQGTPEDWAVNRPWWTIAWTSHALTSAAMHARAAPPRDRT